MIIEGCEPATNHMPMTMMIQVQKVEGVIKALGLRNREHVALVGAGGKTTLLLGLTREVAAARKKVVASTTTKMRQAEAAQVESVRLIECDHSWRERLRQDLGEGRSVFLGLGNLESGKVKGIDRSLLDALYEEEGLDYLLVEADGAAGHPVKAPAEKEPVIPESATMVVAVMGVEALGKPFTPEIVFRVEEFERVTLVAPGETLMSRPLSRIFLHPEGLFRCVSGRARKVVLLNKTDLAHDHEAVKELAGHILAEGGMHVERVVVGSMRTGVWEVYERTKAQ